MEAAVAGATGLVGRRLASLLAAHPWFRLAALLADPQRAGLRYGSAVAPDDETPVPPALEGAALRPLDGVGAARLVFSALPEGVASEWEPRWVREGRWVFTSAASCAGAGSLPPAIPEVNPEALPADDRPARVRSPNCTATGLCLALAPLREFGLEAALVHTLQAESGAGRRGVPALRGGDNVVPHIAGEEERVESEAPAVLGLPGLRVSAHCNRVAVRHGHTLNVSVRFSRPVRRQELAAAWGAFPGCGLPACPGPPLRYLDAPDRPQPALDRMAGGGMVVTVGNLRPCSVLEWKFAALVHNLVRGAAGGLVLNAEFLARRFGWAGPVTSAASPSLPRS